MFNPPFPFSYSIKFWIQFARVVWSAKKEFCKKQKWSFPPFLGLDLNLPERFEVSGGNFLPPPLPLILPSCQNQSDLFTPSHQSIRNQSSTQSGKIAYVRQISILYIYIILYISSSTWWPNWRQTKKWLIWYGVRQGGRHGVWNGHKVADKKRLIWSWIWCQSSSISDSLPNTPD